MSDTHEVRCTKVPSARQTEYSVAGVEKFSICFKCGSLCQNNRYPQNYCFASNSMVGVVNWMTFGKLHPWQKKTYPKQK